MTTIITKKELADLIPSGASIICGGFQTNRVPVELVQAALEGSSGQFALIALPNPIPTSILLSAGKLASLWASFNGLELTDGFHSIDSFRHAVEKTKFSWRESDVYEIIMGLRAAAMGLPFIPAPELQGSQYQDSEYYRLHRVVDPFHGGESVFAVPALAPDIALLHVQKADRQGNLWIEDPLNDELLLQASKRTIVSCEEIVETIERPTVSSIYVDHILEFPGGAAPTNCRGYYQPDEARILDLIGGER